MYRKNKKEEFFTKKARVEGYPARSIYKLKEINEKYNLFKKGDSILDLGCSPGSWLIYCAKEVGPKGKVVGIDLEEIKIALPANVIFIKKDIMSLLPPELFFGRNSRHKYQTVLSDLAPATSGIKFADADKSLELGQRAFEIAQMVLAHNGNFVCKVFEGESSDDFFKTIAKNFEFSKRFRPKAVIKNSKEFYIIGKGFRDNGSSKTN